MGGLPCAKAVIDNGRAVVQTARKQIDAIDRAISCMTNSILLGATVDRLPTEQMEDQFVKAGEVFKNAIETAGSNYLREVGGIAEYYDSIVTDNPASNTKPKGNGK